MPARASSRGSPAAVSLGTHLGVTIYTPSDGGNASTVIEYPNTAGNLQPGLRLRLRTSDPHHEMYLNSGILSVSHGGSSSHVIQMTGNCQYNFSPAGSATPYLTAGVGLVNVGGSSGSGSGDGATSALSGGGFGVNHTVVEGHGSLRMEVRYDLVTKGDTHIESAGLIGFRLGFDLWME